MEGHQDCTYEQAGKGEITSLNTASWGTLQANDWPQILYRDSRFYRAPHHNGQNDLLPAVQARDHKAAIMFIDAQLEKINSQALFAKEQDQLEMMMILHAVRVESANRKKLDLELLFN